MATAVADLRWGVRDALAIAQRNLIHVRHVPEKLLDVTLQPLMFTLLFAYIFGGSIDVPGGDYKSYVVCGIFVQTLAFAVMGTATGMAEDMQNGIVDRFRSLPMTRWAFLGGRAIADIATTLIGLTVLALSGLIVGWGISTDVPHAIGGFALLLLFAFAMTWAGILVGLVVRSVDAVSGAIFVTVFPLTFVANTFVPSDNLPSLLRHIAEWNPISAVVQAVRVLFGNAPATPDAVWPLAHPALATIAWCVGIIAVCAPLAVHRYRTLTR